MHLLDYSMILIYMLAVLAIGFYFSRNENSSEEYLLGGRNMPFIAIGLSCMMSLLSSISIVMTPGEIYRHGLTLYSFSLLNIIFAIPAYLLFVRFYFKLKSFTPYDYLEHRYDRLVRTVIAATILYTKTLYLGLVLFTTSKIFQGAYGWDAWQTILLVGIIGSVYTIMGGMKAVVWSDVMQFVVLAGGFVIVVVILCVNIDGGAWGAITYAFENGRGVPQFANPEFYKVTPYIRLTFWLLFANVIWGPIGDACSNQILIQRLLSTKNWKEGFKAQIVSSLSAIPFLLVLQFVGLALFTFYSQNPDPGLKDADGIFFHFVANNLPSPLPGIFMAAMLAAIMSTLDSGMNSMATIWLKEIHQKYLNKNMDGATEVKVSRWATLIVGVIAISLALLLDGSAKWLGQSAVEVGTLFGALITITTAAFLFAIFSKRANSTMIWVLNFIGIGQTVVAKFWYASSRFDMLNWKAGQALGWAGRLPWYYVVIPLGIGMLIISFWLMMKEYRKHKIMIALLMLGSVFMGAFLGMLLWFAFSNIYITDMPLARSFAFTLPIPINIAVGLIILRFCPVQPKEKWQGLTIWTINDEILLKDENMIKESQQK